MEKRILSVCLTACMLLTLMPSAFAADAEQPLPIAGMEQTEETSADARTEPGDEPQEPVPTEEGKGTQEEPFTTVAAYNEAVKGDALDGKIETGRCCALFEFRADYPGTGLIEYIL